MRFKILSIAALLTAATVSQVAFAEDSSDERSLKICEHESPENIEYSSSFVAQYSDLKVDVDEEFEVKVFIKNTGNTPWFSVESGCEFSNVSLSTDKLPNRPSHIYTSDEGNWETASMVGLDQYRVDPGEVGSFTFVGAYHEEDVLKEYFVPVVHGVKRMEESAFSVDLVVGDHEEWTIPELRKKLLYSVQSGSTKHINPKGHKLLRVDLSDQTVTLELDGVAIRTFQASTGAAATPTPVGNYEISLKQELRIGSKWPHYRMPNFMWFRAGGYGFHSLPYLANDNGVFWEEAWDHIGVPVSHGCVRMLPDDSDFVFDFAEIGTSVTVQY